MSRSILHKSKIDDLKRYLESNGIEWREGKDFYQVMQIKHGKNWCCIFDRHEAKEHYTNDKRLNGLILSFCRDSAK